ncbi:serine/theronine protein kinase 2 [Populus alba x Populus x berolinensis]|uniref:non-specific serine/threonine protein kinase n=1 Tax=Populus alba x Populus x berolinensis TaxID=444605 RepID=A0AAD6QLI5_9ROSI|nr:serine/theronine protein kinase 2 [Populus alba x Populus x berolinensis]KAJ6992648.1 serine/theronine protein kinase 2 [Populus alba x Populus x berolinensis]
MITSIQQKNLVRLLGCCSDGPQRLLVYEYMKNRSLDLIVYGNSDKFLDWNTRFQIILGIARGLQYLHEDSHLRIVHRDVKASNILLDDKFQPRISDFGLARFFPEDQAYLSMHSPELCKYSTNIGVQMKESTLGAIDWLSTYSLPNFPLSPVQRLYSP